MSISKDTVIEGNNLIVLCEADMKRALEWYLNEILLKVAVKVVSVKQINNTQYDGFEIRVSPKELE